MELARDNKWLWLENDELFARVLQDTELFRKFEKIIRCIALFHLSYKRPLMFKTTHSFMPRSLKRANRTRCFARRQVRFLRQRMHTKHERIKTSFKNDKNFGLWKNPRMRFCSCFSVCDKSAFLKWSRISYALTARKAYLWANNSAVELKIANCF